MMYCATGFRNCFDLRPGAIIQYLKLDSPIFAETTNYGHFGRNGFPWEQVNETAMDALEKCGLFKSRIFHTGWRRDVVKEFAVSRTCAEN